MVQTYKPVINDKPYKPYAYCEESEDGIYVRLADYQKLEAELEQLRQQVKAPDADGWIEWSGGERPVPVGTLVDVKWSSGDIDSGEEAGEWRWSNWMNGPNIVAYRVVKP